MESRPVLLETDSVSGAVVVGGFVVGGFVVGLLVGGLVVGLLVGGFVVGLLVGGLVAGGFVVGPDVVGLVGLVVPDTGGLGLVVGVCLSGFDGAVFVPPGSGPEDDGTEVLPDVDGRVESLGADKDGSDQGTVRAGGIEMFDGKAPLGRWAVPVGDPDGVNGLTACGGVSAVDRDECADPIPAGDPSSGTAWAPGRETRLAAGPTAWAAGPAWSVRPIGSGLEMSVVIGRDRGDRAITVVTGSWPFWRFGVPVRTDPDADTVTVVSTAAIPTIARFLFPVEGVVGPAVGSARRGATGRSNPEPDACRAGTPVS